MSSHNGSKTRSGGSRARLTLKCEFRVRRPRRRDPGALCELSARIVRVDGLLTGTNVIACGIHRRSLEALGLRITPLTPLEEKVAIYEHKRESPP
jgi:hypothetical protein